MSIEVDASTGRARLEYLTCRGLDGPVDVVVTRGRPPGLEEIRLCEHPPWESTWAELAARRTGGGS